MATVKQVLNLAKKQLNVKESPAGSNKVKYNTWFYGKAVSGDAYPWCMVFVQWILAQYDIDVLLTAGCTTFMNWAKNQGRFFTSDFKPGDVALYNFDSVNDADHTGIIEKVYDNYNIAIEGNTSLQSDDNGGCVMRRTRYNDVILGVYRPYYEVNYTEVKQVGIKMPLLVKNVKGVPVKTVQRCLRELGYTDAKGNELKVTGIYDAATIAAVKKLQKKRKIDVDGEVGPDTWNELLKGTH